MQHRGKLAIALAFLVATVALTVIVKSHPGPLTGDVGLTVWWQHLVLPHRPLTAVLEEISTLNWPLPAAVALAGIAVVLALFRRWLDILILLAMELADATNWLLSQLVRRPRPAVHGVVVDRHIANFFSFPSGHVEHAVALLGMVVFLTFQVWRAPSWVRALLWVVRIVLLAVIILMLPSRVLEGEHWPSDGVAALCEGGFWLILGIAVYRWAAARWPRLLPENERTESIAPGRAAVRS